MGRLERRLVLLTRGASDAPERQQTLRRTLAWSYDLLPAGEQALFRQLAVFAGGCTVDAVEVICQIGHEPAPDVLTRLATLVDKNVLRSDEKTDGEPRLQMLETVREHALEQLLVSGEEARLRRQHAHYYLSKAEEAPEAPGAVWEA